MLSSALNKVIKLFSKWDSVDTYFTRKDVCSVRGFVIDGPFHQQITGAANDNKTIIIQNYEVRCFGSLLEISLERKA
jgi:hypothetical protein